VLVPAAALVEIVRVPVKFPADGGAKVMPRCAVSPGCKVRGTGGLKARANCDELTRKPLSVRAEPPELLTVTNCGLLVTPAVWVPKLIDRGATLSCGPELGLAAMPVPESDTVLDWGTALLEIISEPFTFPVAAGVNVRPSVVLCPGFSVFVAAGEEKAN
jgi:hypothetical protein